MSCEPNFEVNDKLEYKYIPDKTPYIAGLIEATEDTVHHFPEVIVGYFTDPLDYQHPGIRWDHDYYPNVLNTDLLTQLLKTSTFFELIYEFEIDAEVIVKGPQNSPEEKQVKFTGLEKGLFGDINHDLVLIPGGTYTLTVKLPDKRIYSSTTKIPESIPIVIPDSIGIEVINTSYGDGTPYEIYKNREVIPFNHPEQTHVLIVQSNEDTDRETLLLEPDEMFRFNDLGNYLRSGSLYGIAMGKTTTDTLWKSWIQDLNKPKKSVWNKKQNWNRFSFFNEGVGGNFFPMEDLFTAEEKWENTMSRRLFEAYDTEDSTNYLFDISTIRKVGENGEVLPKEESDAIGFFGGYFSVYKKTTLYPIRNFDLDSVLTAHGYN